MAIYRNNIFRAVEQNARGFPHKVCYVTREARGAWITRAPFLEGTHSSYVVGEEKCATEAWEKRVECDWF